MGEVTQRRLLLALFVGYLVLLTWIVLWKTEAPYVGEAAFLPHPFKWVPFVSNAEAGPSEPGEVVANVLLFMPFGVYLGLIASRWRWWQSLVVFVAASLLLEIAEHYLSLGSFDSTDVIANAAGGLAGLGVLVLARRQLGERTAEVVTKAMAAVTVLSVIVLAVYVASPLRYEPVRDVVVSISPSTR